MMLKKACLGSFGFQRKKVWHLVYWLFQRSLIGNILVGLGETFLGLVESQNIYFSRKIIELRACLIK